MHRNDRSIIGVEFKAKATSGFVPFLTTSAPGGKEREGCSSAPACGKECRSFRGRNLGRGGTLTILCTVVWPEYLAVRRRSGKHHLTRQVWYGGDDKVLQGGGDTVLKDVLTRCYMVV